jgi:nuclear GTP-binding protein
MDYEKSSPRNSRKRSRSISEADAAPVRAGKTLADDAPRESRTDYARQPKRRRKNKDIPDYHAPIDKHALERMDRSNPLSRRNLKRESKRARKAHKAKMLVERGAVAGEMDIDRDELQFTFMA